MFVCPAASPSQPLFFYCAQHNDVIVVFLFEASDSANSKMTDLAFFSKLDGFLKQNLEDVSDQMSKQSVRNAKAAGCAFLSFRFRFRFFLSSFSSS